LKQLHGPPSLAFDSPIEAFRARMYTT